uniref:NADH-ubiquinone oxidoreductase chain 2 n=1 Tax=Asbolus verrucosus TaxID=1661398 RepID=A0A0U2C8P1_ASBVE|nr:NADH dehydrogenase subunit 2 [Asbolus verrucosus]AKJ52241.1 NADH dehydrogenase subunit 2 [Asbolus verrucosus]
MKLYKIMFFNMMVMGTIIATSSYSWFSMWMGLEINLLSIIPLMSTQKNSLSSESAIKYFVTQALASLILLMAAIMMMLINEFITPLVNYHFLMIMNSALLTKLGAAPFHFWFPEVMEGLTWLNCMIMLTWQKIAPMTLIMNNSMNPTFSTLIIISCLLTSAMMVFNQISLRKILTFSSINHIAWMISTTMMSSSSWLIYFAVYCLINMNIIMIFKMTNTFYLKQINNIINTNKTIKFSYMMNFLSLGGLPPFIGFLPKWIVINWLVNNNMYTIATTMIILTLIMLYVYMRITFSSMLLNHNEPKIIKLKINKMAINTINFMTLFSLITCTLIFNLL